MAFDRSIFINKFTAEAREHIQKLNEGLLNLEKNPNDPELIQELFRAAHTVKGSSRMMGFLQTNKVTHKMEDLMGLVREGKLKFDERHFDLMFEALDMIKSLMDEISTDHAETRNVEGIVERMEKAVQGEDFSKAQTSATSDVPASADPPDQGSGPAQDAAAPEMPSPVVIAEPIPVVTPTPPPAAEPGVKGAASTSAFSTSAGAVAKSADETIRVKMSTLDQTIKSVGELLVSRMRARKRIEWLQEVKGDMKNFLKMLLDSRAVWEQSNEFETWENLHQQATHVAETLEDLHKRDRESNALLDKIITDLEENAFQMRMMPLGSLFGNYPRLIRDLSKELGKKIDFVVHGDETQLDKKMIEKLDGPLLHLLRNSVDHGVEKPGERQAKGKPEKGTIQLTAYNESGNVIIEIQDDGNGLNTTAIREKAITKKLIDENEAAKLSERDIQNFIFLPGFSTSQIITDISGRGVGLDVVRKNVEGLKGTVLVDSELGKGARFTITLPLTLSALRVLLVKIQSLTVALPVSSVRETLIVHEDEIINIVDREAIRLRNQIITLVRLTEVLQLQNVESGRNGDGQKRFVVIGEVAKESVGFIIDDIIDEIEVVQKPLPSFMQKTPNVSGVTILGDNEIVLILYMTGLINSARNLRKGAAQLRRIAPKEEVRVREILVVDDSLNTREVEKSIIEAHGYRVDLAKDGLDGLKKTEKKKYDLVVTDVEMPRMDGFSFTRRLRETPEYANIPIVIVTSRESDEDKRRGIEVGANAYIVKGSFDQNNLIDTIDSLVG